jgi:hypothetical protein
MPILPEFPDIKDAPEFNPPADLAHGWPWYVWLVMLGVIILAAGLLVRYVRQSRAAELPPPPPGSPSEQAIQLLQDLQGREAGLSMQQLCQQVVQVIRTWMHHCFGLLANYRTTEEILAIRSNPDQPPPPPVLKDFQDFLLETNALSYGAVAAGRSKQDIVDEAISMIRRAKNRE